MHSIVKMSSDAVRKELELFELRSSSVGLIELFICQIPYKRKNKLPFPNHASTTHAAEKQPLP
jgi:hypothetical protein